MFVRELVFITASLVVLYTFRDLLINSALIIQILYLICIIGISAIFIYRIEQSHSRGGLRSLK